MTREYVETLLREVPERPLITGPEVRILRKRLGVTQTVLAKSVGITQASISLFELEQASLSRKTQDLIVEHFSSCWRSQFFAEWARQAFTSNNA